MLDDQKIYTVIKEKLHASSGKTIPGRLGYAFDMISHDRENFYKGDENYAAAEHYLFARWLVSYTGTAGYALVMLGAAGYTGIKLILPDAILQYFKSGSGPVTPASAGDLHWASRGASDGLVDKFDAVLLKTVPRDPDDPS